MEDSQYIVVTVLSEYYTDCFIRVSRSCMFLDGAGETVTVITYICKELKCVCHGKVAVHQGVGNEVKGR